MKILLAVLLIAISACTETQPQPSQPDELQKFYYWRGKEPAPSFEKDKYDCLMEAAKVAKLGTPIWHKVADMCIESRGWSSQKTIDQATPQTPQQSGLEKENDRIAKQVSEFASDPAHPYFDEVIDEMMPLIKKGMSLQEAYEKASVNCTTQKVGTQWVKKCP